MSLWSRFSREVASLGLSREPGVTTPVTAEELSTLPGPARRFLAFMGVVGRPRDGSLRAGYRGRFRLGPDRGWRGCDAWVYDSGLAVARVMHLRILVGGVIPVIGRDTYVDGNGRLWIRAFDRFTLADGRGPEYDTSELVTYLNDAVLMAPSMLLVPAVSWVPVDADSFDVRLSDRGRTVEARVFVDERGAARDFTTTDRYLAESGHPDRLVRARWSTPIREWSEVEGRPLPTDAAAIWHLPGGDFCYAEMRLVPGSVAFDVQPGG